MIAERTPPSEFSLVRGGPVHRLERRLGVADRLWLRAGLLAVVGWFPPALLSILHRPIGGLPAWRLFLQDYSVQARSLVAVPLLVLAEGLIDARITRAIPKIMGRLAPAGQERFQRALGLATRQRDSWFAALGVVVLAVLLIVLPRLGTLTPGLLAWYGEGVRPTPAGVAYTIIGLPIFLILVVHWLWRFAIWWMLLLELSVLPLELSPSHPDRAGGIGFLGRAQAAFGWVILPLMLVITSVWTNRIVWEGATPASFKVSYVVILLVVIIVTLSPLCAFCPQLWRLRIDPFDAFERFTYLHDADFAARWLRGPPGASPLGAPEISSLQDLRTSYEAALATRLLPVALRDVITLVAATLVPSLLPILATMPFGVVVEKVLRVVISVPT